MLANLKVPFESLRNEMPNRNKCNSTRNQISFPLSRKLKKTHWKSAISTSGWFRPTIWNSIWKYFLNLLIIIRKRDTIKARHLNPNTDHAFDSKPIEYLVHQLARAKEHNNAPDVTYAYANAPVDGETNWLTDFPFGDKLYTFLKSFYGLKGLTFFCESKKLLVSKSHWPRLCSCLDWPSSFTLTYKISYDRFHWTIALNKQTQRS